MFVLNRCGFKFLNCSFNCHFHINIKNKRKCCVIFSCKVVFFFVLYWHFCTVSTVSLRWLFLITNVIAILTFTVLKKKKETLCFIFLFARVRYIAIFALWAEVIKSLNHSFNWLIHLISCLKKIKCCYILLYAHVLFALSFLNLVSMFNCHICSCKQEDMQG